MRLFRTRSFEKDFAELPQGIQTRFEKKLGFFIKNPLHPSLHCKKMRGTAEIWESRISRDYRFTFSWRKDFYILRRIGTHDILRHP